MLSAVAAQAAEGLVARFGRKVLELRPRWRTQGTRSRTCSASARSSVSCPATTRPTSTHSTRSLSFGVKIAVASAEGPPENSEAADIVIDCGVPVAVRTGCGGAAGPARAGAISSSRDQGQRRDHAGERHARAVTKGSWKPDVSACGAAVPAATSFSVRLIATVESRAMPGAADLLRDNQARGDSGLGLGNTGRDDRNDEAPSRARSGSPAAGSPFWSRRPRPA